MGYVKMRKETGFWVEDAEYGLGCAKNMYVDPAFDIPSRFYNKGFAEGCIKKAEEGE